MKKYALLLCLLLLCLLLFPAARARSNPQDSNSIVWVAISESSYEYQAPIPQKTLAALLSGQYDRSFLTLPEVYWWISEKDGVKPQEQAGRAWGYSSMIHIKVDEIIRVTPLTEEHIRSIPKTKSEIADLKH